MLLALLAMGQGGARQHIDAIASIPCLPAPSGLFYGMAAHRDHARAAYLINKHWHCESAGGTPN